MPTVLQQATSEILVLTQLVVIYKGINTHSADGANNPTLSCRSGSTLMVIKLGDTDNMYDQWRE